MRTKDTKTFISNAYLTHADKYSYKNSEYVNQNTPLCIVCQKHGNFWQKPKLHLKGHGCKKCADEYRGELNSKDTNYFVEKAREIYKDFFDYSKVCYIRNNKNIEIICPHHGSFQQTPVNHLNGHGCRTCNGYDVYDTKTFIAKVAPIHNFKFDYSKTSYIKSHSKVIIICPIHGEFKQKPNSHLCGFGCGQCRESSGERQIRKFLTENMIRFESQYRISECKNILPLPFDFAIFDNDNTLRLLIEFHGAQHFVNCSFGSKKIYKNTLSEINRRDTIKINYCIQNKIPLLVIPYWEKKTMNEKILAVIRQQIQL